MSKIQLISILVSFLFLGTTFELVRKRKISESYSVLWIVAGVAILLFSIFENLLTILAEFVGIFYAPAVLIPIVVFFGVVIMLHFSIVISKLTEQNKNLSQEISILKNDIDKMKKNL
jgi:hypothetical protein